jgi:hypothetical protein
MTEFKVIIQSIAHSKFTQQMKTKIFLNAFYNLALIMCIIGAFWAYENKSPLISIFLVAAMGAFLFFKVKLIKELNRELRQGSPKK